MTTAFWARSAFFPSTGPFIPWPYIWASEEKEIQKLWWMVTLARPRSGARSAVILWPGHNVTIPFYIFLFSFGLICIIFGEADKEKKENRERLFPVQFLCWKRNWIHSPFLSVDWWRVNREKCGSSRTLTCSPTVSSLYPLFLDEMSVNSHVLVRCRHSLTLSAHNQWLTATQWRTVVRECFFLFSCPQPTT